MQRRAKRFVAGFGLNFTLLLALGCNASCTCGQGPYEGDYADADRPPPLKGVQYVESEKGDPKVIGCSDGQREGFSELGKFPTVAGCVGKWEGPKSLRDPKTNKACGDDSAACAVPADLCAEGWHVCGNAGQGSDLRDRIKVDDCDNAGPGRFNAALSHSPSDEIDPCPTVRPNQNLQCFQGGLGSEPVCCGNDCGSGKCQDGVWPGRTRISVGVSEGCGAVTSERNGGVICCFDGPGTPTASADAGAAEAGAAEAGAAEAGAAEAGAAAPADDAKKAADPKADDAKKTEEKK